MSFTPIITPRLTGITAAHGSLDNLTAVVLVAEQAGVGLLGKVQDQLESLQSRVVVLVTVTFATTGRGSECGVGAFARGGVVGQEEVPKRLAEKLVAVGTSDSKWRQS